MDLHAGHICSSINPFAVPPQPSPNGAERGTWGSAAPSTHVAAGDSGSCDEKEEKRVINKLRNAQPPQSEGGLLSAG